MDFYHSSIDRNNNRYQKARNKMTEYHSYMRGRKPDTVFLLRNRNDFNIGCSLETNFTYIATDFLQHQDVDKTMEKVRDRLCRFVHTYKRGKIICEILELISLPKAKCVIPELLKIGIFPIVMIIWQKYSDGTLYHNQCMKLLYKIMSECNVKSFETEWHLFLGFSDPLPGTSPEENCSAPRVLEMHLRGIDDSEMKEKLLELNMDKFAADMLSRRIAGRQHSMFEINTFYQNFMRCVNQMHLLFSNPDLQAENSSFLHNSTPLDSPEIGAIFKKYEDQDEDIRRNILLANLISDEPASECRVLLDLVSLHRKQWFLPVLEQDLEKVFCDGPSVETCLLHHDFSVLHSARTLFYLTNKLAHAMNVARLETNSSFNQLFLSQRSRAFVCVYTCDLEHVQGRQLKEDFDTTLLLMRDSAKGMEEKVNEEMAAKLARCQDMSYLIAKVDDGIASNILPRNALAIRNNADFILKLEKVYCFHSKELI